MTGNDHYNKAVALYREYEEKLEAFGDEMYDTDVVLAVTAGLTRILRAAQVQMQMAEYKAKRVRG